MSKMSEEQNEQQKTLYHQKAHNIEAETPMPLSDNLEVDKRVTANGSKKQPLYHQNSFEDGGSTASDILHLYGKKNTARVKLSISYSEGGTRSYLEQPPSIEDCLETNDDFRFQSRTCKCLPKRYVLALLSFFGFFNVYCLRVDLSVTLVAMTSNHTRVRADGTEYTALAEFQWNRELQGHLLAAFYYGYIITQIPGGYIAARFGGKNLFGFAILISGFLTLLTPLAAKEHWVLLFVLRLVEGLCEGCIYPAMYSIWSRWAPPMERAALVTIPHSGSYAGSVAGTLLAGYLCEVCGWSWVFYFFGILALIWVVVWQILASDSPEDDNHISNVERRMILESLESEHTSQKLSDDLPWFSIFTSLPFISIAVAHTCEGWAFGLIQTSFPKYLSEALNYRIFKSGQYTSLIYFLMGFSTFVSGQLSSCLRRRGVSATVLRKVFTGVGFILSALSFMIAPNIYYHEISAGLLIFGAGLEGIAWAGFGVNHLDIAPQYAAILIGITNTCATVPNIIVPIVVGIISKTGERSDWMLVFYISGLTLIVGTSFYIVFGSGEVQPWAGGVENEEGEKESLLNDFSTKEDMDEIENDNETKDVANENKIDKES
uniref:Sialin n=1 Tax=Clytia hemisphaerica TaxID=252671 RepID=A0A7M5WSP1_9CNID